MNIPNKLPILTRDKAGEFHLVLQNLLVKEKKHTFRRKDGKGTFTLQLSKVEILPAGAGTLVEAHPDLPSDATHTLFTGPLFDTIEPDDLDQLYIGNCWAVALLRALAGKDAGRAKLRERIILNPANPAQIIVYMDKSGITTAIFIDFEFTNIAGSLGPSGDVWGLAALKALAFFRTGADTYASENFGWFLEMAFYFGCTSITTPRNVADALAMNAVDNQAVSFTTPERSDLPAYVVPDHVYGVAPKAMQAAPSAPTSYPSLLAENPWGLNAGMGGKPAYITITDADVINYSFSWSAISIPPAVVLPLPASVIGSPVPAPAPKPHPKKPTPPPPLPKPRIPLHSLQPLPRKKKA